jgi:hypothetical protein
MKSTESDPVASGKTKIIKGAWQKPRLVV